MPTHKCPKCDKEGKVTLEYWNFRCGGCGYKTHLLMRRELADLNDPTEGELIMAIVGECLET